MELANDIISAIGNSNVNDLLFNQLTDMQFFNILQTFYNLTGLRNELLDFHLSDVYSLLNSDTLDDLYDNLSDGELYDFLKDYDLEEFIDDAITEDFHSIIPALREAEPQGRYFLEKVLAYFGSDTYQYLRSFFPYQDFMERFKLKEVMLYGSNRLGTFDVDTTVKAKRFKGSIDTSTGELEPDSVYYYNVLTLDSMYFSRILGKKRYELTNHLGNVMAVISDKKNSVSFGDPFTVDYYLPDIKSAQDFFPFGSVMPKRNFEVSLYRYGFNGKELDNEIKGSGNSLDFGARIYDPRIGRFLSIDPLFKEFPFISPYVFAGNDPIRFEDVYGLGPGDRVKKAKSFVGTKYSQKSGLNTGSELRTGTSDKALEYLDCSELVCRVLGDDNITPKVQLWNTSILVTKLNDQTKFHKSDKPKVGDVFLWRTEKRGHTGIVTGVNADGTVEITHAKGTKYGTVTETKSLSYFTNHAGWKGFFRPLSEEIESGPFAKLSNDDLLSKASHLGNRISNAGNWASFRANIQEAKGNTERAAEIRAAGEAKVNRLQQKLDNVNSEIERRGINNDETSSAQ